MTKKSSFCQLIFRLTPLASADKKELFLVIQNYALLSYLEWPLINAKTCMHVTLINCSGMHIVRIHGLYAIVPTGEWVTYYAHGVN